MLREHLDQNKGPLLAVGLLEYPPHPLERSVGYQNRVPMLDEWGADARVLVVDEPEGHHKCVADLCRVRAKGDQLAHALGRADGGEVLVLALDLHKKVAGEHGLADHLEPSSDHLLEVDEGQEGLEALTAQVLKGLPLLSGLGVYGVPHTREFN